MDYDKTKRLIMEQRRICEQPRTIESAPNLGDVVVLILVIAVAVYFFIDMAIGGLL